MQRLLARGALSFACAASACLCTLQGALADGAQPSPAPSATPFVDTYVSIEDERVPRFDQASGAGESLTLRTQIPLYGLRGDLNVFRIKLPFSTYGPSNAEKGAGDMTIVALGATVPGPDPKWALGLSTKIPTASVNALGSGKWSAGPAAGYSIGLGPWRLGFLLQNFFSVAGDGSRPPYAKTQVQPQIEYRLGRGYYLATPNESFSYNWYAGRWDEIPVGLAFGKRFFAGLQGFDVSLEGDENLAAFPGSPRSTVSLWAKYHFPGSQRKPK